MNVALHRSRGRGWDIGDTGVTVCPTPGGWRLRGSTRSSIEWLRSCETLLGACFSSRRDAVRAVATELAVRPVEQRHLPAPVKLADGRYRSRCGHWYIERRSSWRDERPYWRLSPRSSQAARWAGPGSGPVGATLRLAVEWCDTLQESIERHGGSARDD